MGKDQELLEAARTGNLQVVKTILSGKLPRSGPGTGGLSGGWRSILALRPVNVNCTDTSGETPLHLAALNGHREVLLALLEAKASVTEVDSKGCTPLHLAAWNGHTAICDILLQCAGDRSIVNLQTNEGETPLHFAAQHGHHDVVSLLLKNKADPTYRTLSERSALDLAAQYGKTAVVRTLVSGRHELLTHVAGQPSPLHLAAFNGHLPIVGFLLDSGFLVNTRTDNGTALHEAATSCKLDVIKLLLDRGVDVWAKARNDLTAEDILKTINSKLTHEALQIINNHVNSQRTPDSDGERDINGIPGPGNSLTVLTSSPRSRRPVPKPRSMYGENLELSHFKPASSIQSDDPEPQTPPPPLPPRISLLPRRKAAPHCTPPPVPDTGQPKLAGEEVSRSRDASPMTSFKEQPKKPPRKTPSLRKAENSQSTVDSTSGCDGYDKPLPPSPCRTGSKRNDSADSGDHVKAVSKMEASAEGEGTEKDSPCMIGGEGSETGSGEVTESEACCDSPTTQGSDCNKDSSAVAAAKRESLYANAIMIEEERAKIHKPQSLELGDNKRMENEALDVTDQDQDPPSSPTNYSQPPTPDCPPPSPSVALLGIQQKIHALDKRKSKDIETLTESVLFQTSSKSETEGESALSAVKDPHQADKEQGLKEEPAALAVCSDSSVGSLPVRGEQRFMSQGLAPVEEEKVSRTSGSDDGDSAVMTMSDVVGTTTVEMEGEMIRIRRSVSVGEDPADWDPNIFAGLLRGSTPGGPRNVVSQICENAVGKTALSRRRSTFSTVIMFDPVVEKEESREAAESDEVLQESCPAPHSDSATGRAKQPRRISSHKPDEAFDDTEEWAKIAATLETFGGGMARESVFVREFEASFTKALSAGHHSIQSVGEWLEGLGVAQYENTLVANGFDDTDFLGGKIMEDSDLAAIGISNEDHRTVIITAAHKMPPVQSIDQKRLPESVEVWLETLHLGQYLDTFVSHSYNTMQRVVQLWELELNTVLDISSLGHRKRILASLGDRIQTEQDVSQSPSRKPKIACDKDEARRSPFEGVDLYCDYTGVKPQTACTSEQSPLNCIDTTEKNGGCSPEGVQDKLINIRPPHLMHTAGVIHQWRHQPEILIKGCCNYTAHYLGSTVVKELKETSTQEGIAKLKKSTEVINRIPTIVLSISYKGVKFIDGKSKKVVCDHEIANIFCACQDGEHLNFFAYITKDQETSRHYCHVFSVRSREQAGEIILTLGEAFEIAYQMALKEKVEEDVEQIEQQQLSQSDQDDSASLSSKTSVNTV